MENPLISVAIPVYNAVKYIEETINNFLQQTYTNIEVIVQDDCSTDGTWELMLDRFAHEPKVKLERNDKNMGIGPNWNRVYDRVSGKYIVIANADDIHRHNFIEKAFQDIKAYQVDFVTFKYQILFDKIQKTEFTNENKKLKSGIVTDPLEKVFFDNPYHIIFTLFEKDKIDQIRVDGKAFLNTQVCDYELVLRYAKDFTLYYDEELIGYYRLHDSNNSAISLAELKSYYYNVVPMWHSYLKEVYGFRYKKKHLIQLKNYLKALLKRKSPYNDKLLKAMIKYSFI